jgi:hypothetical protein
VRVAAHFAAGDTATTSHARGKALEDLLAHLFGRIGGVRLVRRNALTEDASAEIDLIFWNDRTVLDFLPNILMFECKNWSAPVDSAAVTHFATKATNRKLSHAFLIAANGITGDQTQATAARAHIHSTLLVHDCKLVVLDRTDLCSLASTEQLIALIQERISEIYLFGA